MTNVQDVERIHANVQTNVQNVVIDPVLVQTNVRNVDRILVYVLLPTILQMFNTTPQAMFTRALPATACRE